MVITQSYIQVLQYDIFENNLLEDIHLDECVNCGAGLLAVSDICPQCGFLKSKGDELIEAREKAANENDLDESEEKLNNVVIENYEEFVDKVADDIKNPSRKKSTKIKISRPAGVRLISIFYMAIGVSLTIFAMIFASVVMFMLMSSGFSSLGDIGDMGDIIMLPGMSGGWLAPFNPDNVANVGTVLVQFTVVLVLLLIANRWIVNRMKPYIKADGGVARDTDDHQRDSTE